MRTYFIVEYQASNTGACSALPPLGYTDETAALSAFFTKCAAAAQSECDKHTLAIVDDEGSVWQGYKQVFYHGKE